MKKIITLLLSTLLLASCSKDGVFTGQESINQSKVDQVLDSKIVSERKSAYSLLNENEKVRLWDSKLEQITSSNSFNKKQIELINEIKLKLTPAIFVKDNDEQVYLKSVYLPEYLNRLKGEFSARQIQVIFYNVSRNFFTHVEIETGGGHSDPTCDCNKSSMFSCTWLNSSTCKSTSCDSPTILHQCGFMGMYPCNGLCKPFG